ncbi:MAG: hypothetical protein Fur0028_13290 [Bacteroidales bacterium]
MTDVIFIEFIEKGDVSVKHKKVVGLKLNSSNEQLNDLGQIVSFCDTLKHL